MPAGCRDPSKRPRMWRARVSSIKLTTQVTDRNDKRTVENVTRTLTKASPEGRRFKRCNKYFVCANCGFSEFLEGLLHQLRKKKMKVSPSKFCSSGECQNGTTVLVVLRSTSGRTAKFQVFEIWKGESGESQPGPEPSDAAGRHPCKGKGFKSSRAAVITQSTDQPQNYGAGPLKHGFGTAGEWEKGTAKMRAVLYVPALP